MNTTFQAAGELLDLLGGPANIADVDFCMTRLRVILHELHAVRGYELHDHRVVRSVIKRPDRELDIVVGSYTETAMATVLRATLNLPVHIAAEATMAETMASSRSSGIPLDPYLMRAEPRNTTQRNMYRAPLGGVHRATFGVEWDAVKVLASDGERALAQLRKGIGPVLPSIYTGKWTFLIQCGYAEHWDLRGVRRP
ncbi:PTS transporter subunit EIIB [Streptomyces abikoensis]|uniref:PTS transporter subunit EIIB n=1 Tax=Streptomyces abikoensis TaxID=97398 RepID=A0ABW7TD68_9ACTN